HAHALDPAPPGTARTWRPECQPVIWLLAVSFGHRTLRALCLPSQNLWSSRCAVGTNVTSDWPSGPIIEGLLIWPSNLGGPDRGIMRKLPLPRVPDIEGTRHTLAYGQYRLSYETYGSGDRVLVWLHGLLLDANLSRGLARRLAAKGNRVVLLDLL